MTRDEIYDHLAQVYLGKKGRIDPKEQKRFTAWLGFNIAVTVLILGSACYGLTAFLMKKEPPTESGIIFALNNGPIRVKYNLHTPYPQVKTFTLSVPPIDSGTYSHLNFSIRGLEEGYPDIMRIMVNNQKNESSSYFIDGIDLKWEDARIPLKDFGEITDWTNITDIHFILEAWNVRNKKGIVLIDNVAFSR